jgi:3-isopropylmalate/(R)-2-methylmalate dehydratase small subunit
MRDDFVLNSPGAEGAAILVAGRNFGCGSSREHAPWALLDFGIRAVISTEIADIFRNNALKNGLLPVIVGTDDHRWLVEHPGIEVTVDLETQSVILPGGRRIAFPIDGFSRYCLLHGLDQLGFLLENEPAIRAFEQRLT